MAREAKKPKLTEEDRERVGQYFEEVRDQLLRQWYAQSHDEDPQIRSLAQARLQLQIWLREKRDEVAARKQERDACKVTGATNEFATARNKLRQAQFVLAMNAKMAKEGMSASTLAKACRIWVGKACTLAEILDDRELDRATDFGVIHPRMPERPAHEEKFDKDLAGGQLNDAMDNVGGTSLGDAGVGPTREGKSEKEGLNEPPLKPIGIWSQHALPLLDQYRNAIVPTSAFETTFAFRPAPLTNQDHSQSNWT